MQAKHAIVVNLSLLFIALIWGATFTFTKNALADVSVFVFLFMRFALSAVILFFMVLASSRSRHSLQLKTWLGGVVLGLLLFAVYSFQTLGLRTISPAMSGFLTGLNVVLVPLFAIPILRRLPKGQTWLATLVALCGLALINGIGFTAIHSGEAETIICAAFIALQILGVEKLGARIDALALAAIELLVVAVLSLVVLLSHHQMGGLNMRIWLKPPVFWALMVNAVLGTALAYWGQNVFQKHTSAAYIAIVFSTEPVFAALFSWAASGATLSIVGWMGGLMIFISMLIASPHIIWRRLAINGAASREDKMAKR